MEEPAGFITCSPTMLHPSAPLVTTGLPDLYFVNGIWTSPEDAQLEGTALANKLNRTVRVLYNPTALLLGDPVNGAIEDIEEAELDRLWPATILNLSLAELPRSGSLQHNKTTRQLAYLLHYSSGRLDIVCHSQGVLICRNAVFTCSLFGNGLSNVHAIWTGPPLGDDEILTEPGKLVEKKVMGDPVVDSVGFQAIVRDQNVTKHSFIGNYDILISPGDF